jgi:DNA polymerase III delta subunit
MLLQSLTGAITLKYLSMGKLTLLTGEDTYRLERSVKLHCQAHQQAQGHDAALLTTTVLHEPSLTQLLEAVATVPMTLFGGEALLQVAGWPLLSTPLPSDVPHVEAQCEALKQALPDAVASKHILIHNPKLDKRLSLPKWLLKQPWVTHQAFDPLAHWQTEAAVTQLCHEAHAAHNVHLLPEAATLLVDSFGTQLQPLMMEVAKLTCYTSGQPITPDAVRALCPLNERTFALLEGWLNQALPPLQRQQALNALLLSEAPIKLFALIQTYVGGQLKLKTWLTNRVNEATIAQRLGRKPGALHFDIQRLQQVSLGRLLQLKQEAIELEAAAKLGQLKPEMALGLLLST